MRYGICPLSLISIRVSAEVNSAMITQLLYGESFKILESRKYYSKIRKAFDGEEGWVNNLQITQISKEQYQNIYKSEKRYTTDLVSFIETAEGALIPILIGSSVGNCHLINHTFDGKYTHTKQQKENLIPTTLNYLSVPFLAGGLTPFGLDSPSAASHAR